VRLSLVTLVLAGCAAAPTAAPVARELPKAPDTTTFASDPTACTDDCSYAGNGQCDDGSPGAATTLCAAGTDCDDCSGHGGGGEGEPEEMVLAPVDEGVCSNECTFAHDGECDDGGPGSDYSVCVFGSDCGDCGPRGGSDAGDPPASDPFADLCAAGDSVEECMDELWRLELEEAPCPEAVSGGTCDAGGDGYYSYTGELAGVGTVMACVGGQLKLAGRRALENRVANAMLVAAGVTAVATPVLPDEAVLAVGSTVVRIGGLAWDLRGIWACRGQAVRAVRGILSELWAMGWSAWRTVLGYARAIQAAMSSSVAHEAAIDLEGTEEEAEEGAPAGALSYPETASCELACEDINARYHDHCDVLPRDGAIIHVNHCFDVFSCDALTNLTENAERCGMGRLWSGEICYGGDWDDGHWRQLVDTAELFRNCWLQGFSLGCDGFPTQDPPNADEIMPGDPRGHYEYYCR